MRYPHLALLLLIIPAFGEDQGRLVSACSEGPCKWIAQYVSRPKVIASEQAVLREALNGFELVQPVQVRGDDAAALVSQRAGEFQVVFLKRVEGKWTISKVVDPVASRGVSK
jgi:hypothetical protein